MEIVHVSPEVVPFHKVGGLADVAGALPKALRALGHKVTVFSLRYGSVDTNANALARRLMKVKVPLGGEVVQADIHEARLPSGVEVVLLGGPRVSDRPGVYGENGAAYDDNHLRFALLARGVVEWIKLQPRVPDVLHLHDWTAALVPLYLREAAATDPRLASVKTVFTLHNLAHQGVFPRETLEAIGLPASLGALNALEFYSNVSWLKAAILYADAMVTVSPTYAREVLTALEGRKLDGALRAYRPKLQGILNGLDPSVWNPATDPALAARFDATNPVLRLRNKSDLQRRCGLPVRPEAAVLGMVARFDTQKGVDLVLDAAPQLLRHDLQLVVQGSGDPALMDRMKAFAAAMPDRVAYQPEHDEPHAHRIFAGSDLFLVPSRFEPCGLTQLYAMRYGAVPVVRATGGLRDTVVNLDDHLRTGTGFTFDDDTPAALLGAVGRALTAFQDRPAFDRVVQRVMRQDFSWERPARRYHALYTGLVPAVEAATAAPA
jgi:starch synthase